MQYKKFLMSTSGIVTFVETKGLLLTFLIIVNGHPRKNLLMLKIAKTDGEEQTSYIPWGCCAVNREET